MNSEEKNGWYKDGQLIREKYRSQLAVMIGPVSILLHVRLLRGMKYQVDGSAEKVSIFIVYFNLFRISGRILMAKMK